VAGAEAASSALELATLAGSKVPVHACARAAAGVPLAGCDCARADLTITPTGQTVGLLNEGRNEFTVSFTIPQTITLDAGDYFISVAARYNNPVDFSNEAFQWASSLPDDGVLYSDSYDGSGYQFAGSFARTSTAFRVLGDALPQSCPTDTNADGITDLADLLAVLAAFGAPCD